MNTVVNFELAKLLKEKGFDAPSSCHYNKDGDLLSLFFVALLQKKEVIFAPTIADVVMWLYEKYGIWVSAQQEFIDSSDFSFRIKHYEGLTHNIGAYKSPAEAYEVAIKAVLDDFIN